MSVSTVLFTFTRFRVKSPVFRVKSPVFRVKSPVFRSVRGSTDRVCRHDPSVGSGLQEPEPLECVC